MKRASFLVVILNALVLALSVRAAAESQIWKLRAGDNLDVYLDTVDFPETRLYIMRIYEGFRAYSYLYGE